MSRQNEASVRIDEQVADVLRAAHTAPWGSRDGWLTSMQVRNVLYNRDGIWTDSMHPVRQALHRLPVERKQLRRMTYYRLPQEA